MAIAACASRTPTERERALSKLPSEARLIAAADGPALSALRPALDATRPLLPRSLDCVLDGALTSEAVAIGLSPRLGTTIVLVTRAHVARCPALSRVASDVFVATVGAGAIVEQAAQSALAAPRWSRVKSYLVRDPIALAVDADDMRVLAVAQPKPVDAWLAIDAADITAIERDVRAWIDRQRTTVLGELAGALRIETRGSQLLVRAEKLEAEQLGWLAADLLRRLDAPASAITAPFSCPPSDDDIVRCADDTRIVVRSLASVMRKLVSVDTQPVVAGADVIGIRLSEDAETLLRRGDVILGVDGHRITSGGQLYELARYLHGTAALAVRRDGADIILELSE
jgi:hypothetical protein